MGIGKLFNKVSGDSGEEIACNYLKNHGYKIIKRNYKNKLGEIDIITKKGNTIVFVEVKYKSNDYFGLPREMVNVKKQQKIRMVATLYLQTTKLLDKPSRFDVIEILGQKITHLIDCF